MDCTSLDYPNCHFDAVIDKATLDALLVTLIAYLSAVIQRNPQMYI